MPTASNKVKFQYIGTTAPSTYDGDTIYFDSVNKDILVGSTPVATYNTSINVYNYHPSGIVNEIKANKDQIHYYFYDGYRKLELVWCNTIAVFSSVIPGIRSKEFEVDRDQYYYPGIVTAYVDNNGTITYQDDIELSKKIEFTVSDTNISLRDGTTLLNYTVTSGTNWGNLYTAAQNGNEIILKYNDSVYCKGRVTSYDLDDDEGVIYFYWEGSSCYFKVGYNGNATNQIQIVCGSRNLNNQSF